MPDKLKKWLSVLGGALAVIGFVIVFQKLRTEISTDSLSAIGKDGFVFIAVLGAVYGAANILLAESFYLFVRHSGGRLSRGGAWKVFGQSQIAKYVPGNIIHLASRQALGGAMGVEQKTLAKASLFEIAGLVAAAATFALMAVPAFLLGAEAKWTGVIGLGLAVILSTGVFAFVFLRFGLTLLRAYGAYLAFFAVAGVVFYILFTQVSGHDGAVISPFVLVGAFAAAWLAGFITPGAPAGIGVREFVLMSLLSAYDLEAAIVTAVVLARMTTIIGDFLAYVGSFLLSDSGLMLRSRTIKR